MYSSDNATISLFKESMKGDREDYVIKFNEDQPQIENVILIAFDVVK